MKLKKLNKKGVFGLTAVQAFFSVLLGLALLAYVIVIIMGTLTDNDILALSSYQATNESNAKPTTAGITLNTGGIGRAVCGTITEAYNGTNQSIALANFTQTGCQVVNASNISLYPATIRFTYPYTATSQSQQDLDNALGNTSSGITSFFSAINPIFAILAVLVIILVLVVLVRVVQSPNKETSSQL